MDLNFNDYYKKKVTVIADKMSERIKITNGWVRQTGATETNAHQCCTMAITDYMHYAYTRSILDTSKLENVPITRTYIHMTCITYSVLVLGDIVMRVYEFITIILKKINLILYTKVIMMLAHIEEIQAQPHYFS